MKMSREHYEYMREAMRPLSEKIPAHREALKDDPRVKDTGARTRLAVLMANYPTLRAYIQTDPRGAALYLLTAEQVAWNGGSIEQLDSIYSRGTAIY